MVSITGRLIQKFGKLDLGWTFGDVANSWWDAGTLVRHSENEFSVVTNQSSTDIKIDRINRIAVYKVDMFAYDTICWEISQETGENRQPAIHINEEMTGYDGFCECLSRLKGFDKDWFAKVFKPPFAENYTIVYRREPTGP